MLSVTWRKSESDGVHLLRAISGNWEGKEGGVKSGFHLQKFKRCERLSTPGFWQELLPRSYFNCSQSYKLSSGRRLIDSTTETSTRPLHNHVSSRVLFDVQNRLCVLTCGKFEDPSMRGISSVCVASFHQHHGEKKLCKYITVIVKPCRDGLL